MCSLNDTDENYENFWVADTNSINESTCRGCKNKALVVLRKKDLYCRNCFLATATHKFRATLGKSKMMKPQDKVLFAFSGSQSSVALLHLLHSGVTENQHKKLLFSVSVLYIDEGVLVNTPLEKRLETAEKIKEKISACDFPVFLTTLSEALSDSPTLNSTLNSNEKNDCQLLKFFENIKSMSSKEDALYVIRQKLILSAAKNLNCNKVFTAEVGTDLAVKLLSCFSLGRGDQASFDTGFCDSRHPCCKILRPLRDFTKKEIVFYNKFHLLEEFNIPTLTTKSPSNISIQKLTEKFVMDLEGGFPSTVYTIFRTAEKLSASAVEKDEVESVCLLCQRKIRTNSKKDKCNAVEAANFSRIVSGKKSTSCGVNEEKNCCGSCSEEKMDGIIKGINKTDLEKFLCYGCTLIVRDMKNVDCLPKDLLQSAVQRRDFETMKEQISEFLIDGSSELEV